MKFRWHAVLTAICLVAATVVATSSWVARRSAERRLADQIRQAAEAPPLAFEQEIASELVVSGGSSLADLLGEMSIGPEVVAAVAEAARPVFDFRRLRQGHRITVSRSVEGRLESIAYDIDPDHELRVSREGERYRAEVRDVPSRVKVEALAGEVHGSLFESVMEVGERAELALRLAEIFAYDLDFYTDVQPGDSFRLVLEKREYSNGQPPSYGRILMAEYNNAGHPYQAVLFAGSRGEEAYYSPDGKSLRKAFLRSPLKFAARVSSHFNRRRFHPVLKIYRPHLGTDYAAPTGTPVQAIAGGRVTLSARAGGGGNTVQIRHANGYVSYYMHLSRRLVRTGQQVQQGQRIGLVGATGLATGPHLDFRMRRNGQFVNFERIKLPPAHPVPEKEWAAFVATRDRWQPLLAGAVVKNQGSPMARAQGGGASP